MLPIYARQHTLSLKLQYELSISQQFDKHRDVVSIRQCHGIQKFIAEIYWYDVSIE